MIELKPQLPILTYPDGLKTFVADQTTRRARVKTAIDNAASAVQKARDSVTVPVIGDSKRVGNSDVTLRTSEDAKLQSAMRSHAQRQTVKLIGDIRAELDKVAVPIIKDMTRASDLAKEYAARHFDIHSVLRRARGTASGLMEATQLRAYYAEILEDIEPRELAAFAQQAIDQGDPILADAIQRENFTRSRDGRAFMNATFLGLIQNTEFETAQAQLATVTMLYEQATVQYATFGREFGAVSLQRMAYGLNYGNSKLNEDGSISPKNIPAHFADAGE